MSRRPAAPDPWVAAASHLVGWAPSAYLLYIVFGVRAASGPWVNCALACVALSSLGAAWQTRRGARTYRRTFDSKTETALVGAAHFFAAHLAASLATASAASLLGPRTAPWVHPEDDFLEAALRGTAVLTLFSGQILFAPCAGVVQALLQRRVRGIARPQEPYAWDRHRRRLAEEKAERDEPDS